MNMSQQVQRLQSMGQTAAAIQTLSDYAKKHPDPRCYGMLGEMYRAVNQYERAAQNLEMVSNSGNIKEK